MRNPPSQANYGTILSIELFNILDGFYRLGHSFLISKSHPITRSNYAPPPFRTWGRVPYFAARLSLFCASPWDKVIPASDVERNSLRTLPARIPVKPAPVSSREDGSWRRTWRFYRNRCRQIMRRHRAHASGSQAEIARFHAPPGQPAVAEGGLEP